MKKKITITIICAVLSCVCLIGTTFAWLTDKTGDVVNTFTVGDVDIELTETTGDEYKLVPGKEYAKDPTVTVKAKSETCWVFVKVVKGNNPDSYLNYTIDTAIWTALTGVDGVYYKEVTYSEADQPFTIITGNQVTVKSELTRTQLQAIVDEPTLTFTAYAVQREGFDNVADAWTAANS